MCDGQDDQGQQGEGTPAPAVDFSNREVRVRQLCRQFWIVEVERGAVGLQSLRLEGQGYNETVQLADAERGAAYLLFKFRRGSPGVFRLYYNAGQEVMVWKGLRMPDQQEPREPRSMRATPRLDRVHVVVEGEEPNASTARAPANTHVYLTVAGKYDQGCAMEGFRFNHFQVRADHRLGVPGGGEVCLPSPTLRITNASSPQRYGTYWCNWGDSAMSDAESGFRLAGGHFPVPARFTTQKHLVLPGTKPLYLWMINLAYEPPPRGTRRRRGDPPLVSTIMANDVTGASPLYDQLRIRLVRRRRNWRPDTWQEGWYLDRQRSDPNMSMAYFAGTSIPPATWDMRAGEWGPTGRARNYIPCLYVRSIGSLPAAQGQRRRGSTVPGAARPLVRLLPNARHATASFTPPDDYGLIFLVTDPPRGNTDGWQLQHELGHVLLDTFGKGQSFIAGERGLRNTVYAKLGHLGIDIEGPRSRDLRRRGRRLHDLLTDGTHVEQADLQRADYATRCMGQGGSLPSGSNLMYYLGGSSLLPWQVAIMRAALEVCHWQTHTP